MDIRYQTDTLRNKTRKTPVRLDEHEKFELARYLIENKLVQIDKEGRFTRFRNFEKDILTEINTLEIVPGKQVSAGYHLKDAMEFYHTICALTDNMPSVPVQDSVQEDILKIELQKVMKERDEMSKEIENLRYLYARAIGDMEKTIKNMQVMIKVKQ